jgi:acyl-CoA synthetase (NDP forming)
MGYTTSFFAIFLLTKNRMLHNALTHPRSIAVIGGSENIHKPGGKLVQNLIQGSYTGDMYVVNPKKNQVQGVDCVPTVQDLPDVDLAILAIPAHLCLGAVQELARKKNTRGFIIISAGFSEADEEGFRIEKAIREEVESVGGSLIGPNCIGIINGNYQGVFTTPVPKSDPSGADLISGSGATAVFIMETGMVLGLHFNEVYSVGNSAQIGVEDVLEHLDETYDPGHSAKIKLLYIEDIKHPQKLLKHASSLIRKGCRIAAIKAGISEGGMRAASSHTGALASSDVAVRALFKRAGIVYCSSRLELITVASIFYYKPLLGKNIAVITHAGGSAVMLTDALEKGGLKVPALNPEIGKELLEHLHPGSSVVNPIDFLATGTAEQLGIIIDFCENRFDEIDGMVVVFGSPGLFNVEDVYRVLNEKMDQCKKPVFPVLPSVVNAAQEIQFMRKQGRVNFPDEVLLGTALTETFHTPKPRNIHKPPLFQSSRIFSLLTDRDHKGFLRTKAAFDLLDEIGINNATPVLVQSTDELSAQENIAKPWVLKVSGPVHKTDVGGVTLNVNSTAFAVEEVNRMLSIPDADGVIVQPMIKGKEFFAGAIRDPRIGPIILVGLGGIYVEILKDVRSALAPLDKPIALKMIHRLASYPMIQGMRGQEGFDEEELADVLVKLSALVTQFPEIQEIDLNPLMANADGWSCVDVRIRVKT